ncbi:MAG: S8 family serine peptidase [Verrucomicrobia bacterium]|nr:S8 family serine peptidase [Verrucomicrobiota bacterium]
MENRFKIRCRILPARRLRNTVLGGLASALLLLKSGALFAAVTTIELSPLIYKSTLIAPTDGNKQIGVVLVLPSSDPAGLTDLVKHVSTPGDPLFRKYLTPRQFAQKFGGNESDYTALKNWAAANGLAVSQESITRTNLTVRGSVAQLQTLFKTQLNTYQAEDGQTFYSASIKPAVPVEIASKISGVIGLTASKPLAHQSKIARVLGEEPKARSDKMRADTAGGTGPGGTYSCTDLRYIYSIPNWGNLEKGMIVAVFEQGYYRPSDVDKYFDKFNVGNNTKQTAIAVDQSPIDIEPSVEGEDCLDIDMLVGMNPNIAEVKVYIDDFHYDPFSVAMVDAFQAIADDGTPQIVSVSYGEDEGYFGTSAENAENTTLQQLAVEGITVLASAGDGGAFGDGYNYPYNVSEPASNPYVTGVGGTTLFTDSVQNYEYEIAWDDFPNYGATGGGVSSFWQIPDYQLAAGGTPTYTDNGGSGSYRNVPDVAAVADPLTGVGIYVKDYGGWTQIGGTSVSCPIWAGYLSTINPALKWSGLGNLGFFNPSFYALGTKTYGYGVPYEYTYNIQGGSNGYIPFGGPGYINGLGYSNTTGFGSIWGAGLGIQILSGGLQPGTSPGPATISIVGKPTPTSVKVTWTASSGANAYLIGLYSSDPYTGGYYGPGEPFAYAFLVKADNTSYKIDHLVPNTQYWVYVYGYNASGSASSYVSFTTPKR